MTAMFVFNINIMLNVIKYNKDTYTVEKSKRVIDHTGC